MILGQLILGQLLGRTYQLLTELVLDSAAARHRSYRREIDRYLARRRPRSASRSTRRAA